MPFLGHWKGPRTLCNILQPNAEEGEERALLSLQRNTCRAAKLLKSTRPGRGSDFRAVIREWLWMIQLECFQRTDPWASGKHDSSYAHERFSPTNFVYPLISTAENGRAHMSTFPPGNLMSSPWAWVPRSWSNGQGIFLPRCSARNSSSLLDLSL